MKFRLQKGDASKWAFPFWLMVKASQFYLAFEVVYNPTTGIREVTMENNNRPENENLDPKDYEHGYKKYLAKAKEYLNDKGKSMQLLGDATEKADKNEGALGDAFGKLQLLFQAFRAWIKGDYKQIPTGSIVMIIATILYFVSPVDLIPDFILGLGLIDDAAVIGFALKQVSKDLDKFRIWKETEENSRIE